MRKNDVHRKRLDRLRRSLRRERLDAYLVWDRANTRYLSGFGGSASLICLTRDSGYFLTDFRYRAIAKSQVEHLRVVETKPPPHRQLARLLGRQGARRVGFEETIPYRLYRSWCEALNGIELVEATAVLRRLRECKRPEEVDAIARAQNVAEKALETALAHCRPGITERQLKRRLVHAIEEEGGEGPAFDPIVASGPNAALPHAHPGERRVKKGDFVIFDLGAIVDGYASDMTRTIVVGRATERQKRVYQTVLQAQRRAIAKIGNGVAASEVDRAARAWIEGNGFGKKFGHGTGHGVGLEVHESPALNARSNDVLRTGMIVTVEPGIYIGRWGGVRIEDMVRVKRTGREVLARFPKRLIECNTV